MRGFGRIKRGRDKMKTLAIAVIVAGVMVLVLVMRAGAQSSVHFVPVPARPYVLQLGTPSEAAHTTATGALHAAEVVWSPTLFADHPYTVQYGSYRSNLVRHTAGGPAPVGTRDVWAITVTGLDIQRPSGEIAQSDGSFKVVAPPDIHTEVVVIDDKTGGYLESIGS